MRRQFPWGMIGASVLAAGMAAMLLLYVTVPAGNTGVGPVDALLVLGTPADMHGNLTETQRWRTDEAVLEFQRGQAPYILFSGGPTSHGYTEADVMARYAIQRGVPADRVLVERRAFTTAENITNSAHILRQMGWTSTEVISTPEHLRRAALFLQTTGLRWRTHPAPTPGRPWSNTALAFAEEAFGTAAIRIFGPGVEPVLHTLARGQHKTARGARVIYYDTKGKLQ